MGVEEDEAEAAAEGAPEVNNRRRHLMPAAAVKKGKCLTSLHNTEVKHTLLLQGRML